MRIRHALLLCLIAGLALAADAGTRTVHVFVALADNAHQGIVPISAKLGNGDDPNGNLYWGAMYGVRTFFRKSADWTLLATLRKPATGVLERCVFKHKKTGVLLVADAYQGKEIKRAVTDFLSAASGGKAGMLKVAGKTAATCGGADLVAYVGHDGLMDFNIDAKTLTRGVQGRQAIILACMSKQYFQPWLAYLKAKSLLLTTNLMCPEAYTLHAALDAWIAGKSGNTIKERAAQAYNRYQKCGMKAARNLFYSSE